MNVQTDEQKEAEIERRTQERVARALDGIDARLLTEKEAAALRAMLERDGRVQWAWSAARTVAVWIAAFAAGFIALRESLRGLIRWVGAP